MLRRLAVRCVVLLPVLWLIAQPQAQGQSRQANLKVSATVVDSCVITADPLNFGPYDPVSANASQPLDATSTVTVTCTKGAGGWLYLYDGANAAQARATINSRRAMAGSTGALLAYDLFKDSGRVQRWGRFITGLDIPAAPSSAPRTFTVYGRIRAGQDVPLGAYSDTVVLEVVF